MLLTGLSLLLCCLIFPPIEWWWFGYVCLVPWLVCVCTAARSKFVYLTSWLFGLSFFLILIRWMVPVTWEGYLALCLGFSVFFPLAAWPIRHMFRRHGVSVALTAPIAWVATEYLRSLTDVGFPFLLLGHSQYHLLTVIQISDLVGAYGVSFVLMMVNGWVTDLLIQPILIWRADRMTRLPVGSMTTLLVVLGTLIYGSAQRSSNSFQPGPKVAVVQHDFAMYVDDRAKQAGRDTIFRAYLALARKAALEKPDLIVLPETAISCYINEEFVHAKPEDLEEIHHRRFAYTTLGVVKEVQRFSKEVRNAFQALSTESGVPIVFGSSSLEWRPKAIPPGVEAFNSAFLLVPGESRPVARYDKIHLVLFGEYVPFRYSQRRWYEWLNNQTPWGKSGIEYSLLPGSDYTVFEFTAASLNGQRFRAAVPICYEEIMPYITRRFVRGSRGADETKYIDMLLSISNDGWFLHTEELQQHLAAAVFRAVENRIPIARSVNTGASAQIDPNGKIHGLVTLSAENRKMLEPLGVVLDRLAGLADRMTGLADSNQGYAKAFEEAGQVYLRDLYGLLRQMGPEFEFIAERLSPAMYDLTARTAKGRLNAAQTFRRQVGEELDTVSRWRDQPWTAPGYLVADMKCDARMTVYTRWGDWFGQAMVALLAMMLMDWLMRRFWKPKTPKSA